MKHKSSWKEVFQVNHRAFLLLYKKYPAMICSRFISTIWNAWTPYIGIYLSALVIEELAGEKNPQRLKELVLITLLSAAGIAFISVFLSKWNNEKGFGLWFKMEKIYQEKLLDMDFVSIDDTKVHELLSLIRQNRNGGGWGLDRVISNYESLLSAIFTLIGGIALTVSLFTSKVPEDAGLYTMLNQPLFLVVVIVVMLAVTYIAPVLSNKADSFWAVNADKHRFVNRLFGFFGWLGHDREFATDVRIYQLELLCNKYNSGKYNLFGSQGIFAKYALGPIGLYKAASSAVSVIFTGVVYVFVCLKALAGAFGIGMVTQYIASISKVSGGVSSMIAQMGDMRNNAIFLDNIFEFLDIPNTMYQGSLTVEKRRDREYEVEFRDVSFKYPNSEIYALKHVNMKFKVGNRLAVVGMNGSGKTTFIKLLCRLYDPTEGEILLNGIDIRKYNYLDYMMIFSIVFQDFNLFSLKLAENVAAKVDYDTELVMDCLKKAGFSERLETMEDGIESYLYKDYEDKGINISGGEAQKIAIARALYKDAPFIILDEPTAALDPIAEAEIYSKFDEFVGDKTAVYISHRLSSCKFCDEIMVFDEGLVVQQGTHADLVADKDGKYYELWNAQATYYVNIEQVAKANFSKTK